MLIWMVYIVFETAAVVVELGFVQRYEVWLYSGWVYPSYIV